MITDLHTHNFNRPRGSSEAMVNIHSSRSGNGLIKEFETGIERQGEMTQVMYSLDSSNDHESITSNYKRKRQQSLEEHKMLQKKPKVDKSQGKRQYQESFEK